MNLPPDVRDTDLCVSGGSVVGLIAAVQDAPNGPLHERLLADDQVLEWKSAAKR